MGYEVYTKPYGTWLSGVLAHKSAEQEDWQRVGANAEMMAWKGVHMEDFPYPLDLGYQRFWTGKAYRFSGLLHFGPHEVTADLPGWFHTYNARQIIEAGNKEGKQVSPSSQGARSPSLAPARAFRPVRRQLCPLCRTLVGRTVPSPRRLEGQRPTARQRTGQGRRSRARQSRVERSGLFGKVRRPQRLRWPVVLRKEAGRYSVDTAVQNLSFFADLASLALFAQNLR